MVVDLRLRENVVSIPEEVMGDPRGVVDEADDVVIGRVRLQQEESVEVVEDTREIVWRIVHDVLVEEAGHRETVCSIDVEREVHIVGDKEVRR